MDDLWLGLRLLLLLGVANTAPILAKRVLGDRACVPLDGGLRFIDGRPLLGASKTVRGLVASVLATSIAAGLVGLTPTLGALVGLLSMAGDALSSFTKRRLGVAPSGRATGLDQIPEALLPLLVLDACGALEVSVAQTAGVTIAFFALEMPLAWLMHRLGWRDQPY